MKHTMCIYELEVVGVDGITTWILKTPNKKKALQFLEASSHEGCSLKLTVYTIGGSNLWNISGTEDTKLIFQSLAS